MHHPTDMIAHTTAFVTPVVEHWLEREIFLFEVDVSVLYVSNAIFSSVSWGQFSAAIVLNVF